MSDERAQNPVSDGPGNDVERDAGPSVGRNPSWQNYLRFKFLYEDIALPGGRDSNWLADFDQEPNIPAYTENLDLRTLGEIERHYTHRSGANRSVEELKKSVERVMRRSPYLGENGVDKDFWIERVLSLVEGPNDSEGGLFLEIFYATCFPNIKTLKLGLPWSLHALNVDSSRVKYQCELVLNIIARQSQTYYGFPSALRHLERLEYQPSPDKHPSYPLQLLLPFAVLPNLGALVASKLTSIALVSPITWANLSNINSNLSTIELVDCCIDASAIDTLLARTPHLTSFKYVHAVNDCYNTLYSWNAYEFVAAITKHVGHRLRDLTIGVHHDRTPNFIAGVESLHGFPRLKSLDIDYFVLRPLPLYGLLPRKIETCTLRTHFRQLSCFDHMRHDRWLIFRHFETDVRHDLVPSLSNFSLIYTIGNECGPDYPVHVTELGEWAREKGIGFFPGAPPQVAARAQVNGAINQTQENQPSDNQGRRSD